METQRDAKGIDDLLIAGKSPEVLVGDAAIDCGRQRSPRRPAWNPNRLPLQMTSLSADWKR